MPVLILRFYQYDANISIAEYNIGVVRYGKSPNVLWQLLHSQGSVLSYNLMKS